MKFGYVVLRCTTLRCATGDRRRGMGGAPGRAVDGGTETSQASGLWAWRLVGRAGGGLSLLYSHFHFLTASRGVRQTSRVALYSLVWRCGLRCQRHDLLTLCTTQEHQQHRRMWELKGPEGYRSEEENTIRCCREVSAPWSAVKGKETRISDGSSLLKPYMARHSKHGLVSSIFT